MTRSPVLQVSQTAIQRKDYGLATKNEWGGLVTVPFFGVGEQIVENMRFESGFYRKMFGNSLFATISGFPDLQDILIVREYDKGDGTFQRIVAFRSSTSPDRYKIRAIEDDGTITVPGGAVGDFEFESPVFGWIQIGLVGYVSNKSTGDASAANVKNLFSWDGTELTAVTNAPDNPDFISRDGQRIALGAEGIMNFSQESTTALTSFTGGTGAAASGNYNVSSPGAQTGAVSAAGGIVIFFERGAELHQVIPTSDGQELLGQTRISAATGSAGWNYNGNGIKNNFQVTRDDNYIYFINIDGVLRMNPLTGETQNLVESNGAIQAIWEGLDLSDSVIEFSPKDRLVCVATKENGEAVNDQIICWDIQDEKFYIKTNPTAKSLGVINNQLYAGEQSGSNVYAVFDEDSFEDGDGGTYTARIIREWDGLGDPKSEKRLQRIVGFCNVSPDSSFNINAYIDGFSNLVDAVAITSTDIENSSDLLGTYADYIWASGTADQTDNTDIVTADYSNQRFGLITLEFTESSQLDFRVYNYTLVYTQTPTSEGTKFFVRQSYSGSQF